METFDLIILGGGPAGYRAAQRAAQGGLKTVVFEKRSLGGVCLNVGCTPSKALLNSATIYESPAHGEKYGVSAENVKFAHPESVGRKVRVGKQLV